MKFYTRLGVYKATNVEFNPKTMQAYSYRWWRFVEKIGKRVVFNNYTYSVTTSKHQSKVLGVLRELNIKPIFVECPQGLQDLTTAVLMYERRIESLLVLINTPKTRKAKNEERRTMIRHYREKIKTLQSLQNAKLKAA